MIRAVLFSTLAFGLGGLAFAANDNQDIDKVNGSIHVQDNTAAGKLSTVNGGVHVGANAHATSAETVNGGIDLDSGAVVDSLETVNGGIRIGANAKVAKTVEAVNGSITLDAGADIGGRVSNVNGGIRLEAAHIGGGIGTVSGDITVGAKARIEGGIFVDRPNGGWFHIGSERKPRIVIGPQAVVQGALTFKRDVDLFVSDRATIGAVDGASVVKFSGDQPTQ